MYLLKHLWSDESGVEPIEYAYIAGLWAFLSLAVWDKAGREVAVMISPTFDVGVVKIVSAVIAVVFLGAIVLRRKHRAE